MGNINMQELGSPARSSRIIRNHASLDLAVVVVALLVTSSRGIAVSEPVEKISSPVQFKLTIDRKKFGNLTLPYRKHNPFFNTTNCHAEQYRFGQWIPGAANCGLKSQYDHKLERAGSSPEDESLSLPWSFSDWCWKPNGCISEPFSVDGFCKKLRGRRILLVGDSMQHVFYDALFMQAATPGQPLSQFKVFEQINESEAGICNGKGGGMLMFLRNDQISVSNNTLPWNHVGQKVPEEDQAAVVDPDKRVVVTNRDWKSVADNFDLIVLNKGAHTVPLHTFIKDLEETGVWLKDYLQSSGRQIQIFFRTTPQGHHQASKMITAVTEPLEQEPKWLKKEETIYGWEMFPLYDKHAIRILKSHLGANLTILNVSPMTHLRPDGHICFKNGRDRNYCDMLHYFLPSVVDAWVQVFFNLLPL
jgi:hypothetical protein